MVGWFPWRSVVCGSNLSLLGLSLYRTFGITGRYSICIRLSTTESLWWWWRWWCHARTLRHVCDVTTFSPGDGSQFYADIARRASHHANVLVRHAVVGTYRLVQSRTDPLTYWPTDPVGRCVQQCVVTHLLVSLTQWPSDLLTQLVKVVLTSLTYWPSRSLVSVHGSSRVELTHWPTNLLT